MKLQLVGLDPLGKVESIKAVCAHREAEKQDADAGAASLARLDWQGLAWSQPSRASHHRRRAGDALDDGAGWRAADGVEDLKRVRENTLHAIFHGTDLVMVKSEILN